MFQSFVQYTRRIFKRIRDAGSHCFSSMKQSTRNQEPSSETLSTTVSYISQQQHNSLEKQTSEIVNAEDKHDMEENKSIGRQSVKGGINRSETRTSRTITPTSRKSTDIMKVNNALKIMPSRSVDKTDELTTSRRSVQSEPKEETPQVTTDVPIPMKDEEQEQAEGDPISLKELSVEKPMQLNVTLQSELPPSHVQTAGEQLHSDSEMKKLTGDSEVRITDECANVVTAVSPEKKEDTVAPNNQIPTPLYHTPRNTVDNLKSPVVNELSENIKAQTPADVVNKCLTKLDETPNITIDHYTYKEIRCKTDKGVVTNRKQSAQTRDNTLLDEKDDYPDTSTTSSSLSCKRIKPIRCKKKPYNNSLKKVITTRRQPKSKPGVYLHCRRKNVPQRSGAICQLLSPHATGINPGGLTRMRNSQINKLLENANLIIEILTDHFAWELAVAIVQQYHDLQERKLYSTTSDYTSTQCCIHCVPSSGLEN
uniref:Phosphodiesterase I n=1 Tax=Trichobilharzia regenti TaxID=157069 RepID=A0AA85J054_TRIRE|nr:unnamed protein product [Trichobilharzia regenti]